MRDCPSAEIRDLLPDFASGSLKGEARARVDAHVAQCADCAAELELLRAVRRLGRDVPPVDVARIVAALPPAPRGRGPRRFAIWRVAAAVAVLAGGAAAVRVVREGSMSAGVGAESTAALPPTATTATTVAPSPPGDSGRQVAVAAPRSDSPRLRQPAAPAAPGMSLAGGVSDLSDADVESLLAEL